MAGEGVGSDEDKDREREMEVTEGDRVMIKLDDARYPTSARLGESCALPEGHNGNHGASTGYPGWSHGAADSNDLDAIGCEGHESLGGAHMGESVYCDGSCIQ